VLFPIPARLAARSSERGDWLEVLPGTVYGLTRRWSLHLGPPFGPGGETAWVAPAGDGLVLKVGWVHDEARDEAAGLRAWAGQGAVPVLAEHTEGSTAALLLEWAMPGTPLTALPEPEQNVVLAGLLRRLWIEPPAQHFLDRTQRRLALAIWATGFAAGAALGPVVGGVPLEHAWWGSVFLVNTPVMLVILALATTLPESRTPAPGGLDLLGLLLSLLTMVPFVLAVKTFAEDAPLALAELTLAVVAGTFFVARARGRRQAGLEPLLDVELFAAPWRWPTR
jgi:hypothetical protein